MAEIVVGDIVARLRADLTQFNQAMQEAITRLGQLNQAQGQVQQQQATSQQSTNQLATAYLAMAQSISQQTQAYAQAQSATLQYRQQQDQLRESLRQQREAQRQATAAAREAAVAAQQSGNAFRSMVTIAGGVGLATGIGALVGQMKQLAVETVQVGTRFESLRASLSALGGGPATGGDQFRQLLDTAQRLGVAFEPLARGFRTLTAAATQANLPIAEQRRLLDALAKEAQRTGASNEELQRAIIAVAQTASKGVVSMEELRGQLGEAIPTAMAAAAKGMGITTEELSKLVETGTLRFAPFAQALTRGFEQLQKSSGDFAEGNRQAFNRLENSWKEFQDTVMKSGLNAYIIQVTENLRAAVEWATKQVRPFAPTQGPPTVQQQGTAEQQKTLQGLQRVIDVYSGPRTVADVFTSDEHRASMVAKAKEEREQILAVIEQTVVAKNKEEFAQFKIADAANKTKFALELQAGFAKSLSDAMAQAAKNAEEFRQKAAAFPERHGRVGGTLEEAEKFRSGLAEVVAKDADALAALIQKRPAGTDGAPRGPCGSCGSAQGVWRPGSRHQGGRRGRESPSQSDPGDGV